MSVLRVHLFFHLSARKTLTNFPPNFAFRSYRAKYAFREKLPNKTGEIINIFSTARTSFTDK